MPGFSQISNSVVLFSPHPFDDDEDGCKDDSRNAKSNTDKIGNAEQTRRENTFQITESMRQICCPEKDPGNNCERESEQN